MRNSAVILLFILFSINGYGQTYPFEVQKTGQGDQAIIFIPGFASSGEVWDETKALFENDFSCYTLTMAGFAGVAPQPNASFENWKEAIARFIQDQNIQKPTIVGHSMGGGLAMAIAADYPNLIDKIVVVDALPCLQALSNPGFDPDEAADCTPMINQITQLTDEQFLQMQKMSVVSMASNTAMHERIISWSVKSDRTVFAEIYCDFWNTDLREKIKSIECPALVLLEANFVNIKQNIEEQYQNLKTVQFAYANKGLHFIMYDDKGWYFSRLTNFILKQ